MSAESPPRRTGSPATAVGHGSVLVSDPLRAFSVFAEDCNMTHAARRLGLTQPALFAQLARLAEEVGGPVYERRGRSLTLTAIGEVVLAHARQALDARAQLLRELGAEGGPTAPVVLATGEGAMRHLLGPALQVLVRDGGRLRVLVRDRARTIEAVLRGEAHLGVTVLDATPAELSSRELVRVPQALVVPRGHALARKKTVVLADLAGASLVLPPPDRPQRVSVGRALASAGVAHDVAVEVTGWDLAVTAVQLGLGLAIVNDFGAKHPGCVVRPLRELPPIPYGVVWRAAARASRPVDALKRAIVEACAASARTAAERSKPYAS